MATTVNRVPILPFGMVNAHLISAGDGSVLVDAGLRDTEKRVARALGGIGRDFRDIRLIVVTHAHVDHAGNAARGAQQRRDLAGA